MKKRKLNTELFKKIREKIATAPEAYDQNTYGRAEELAPCGTAACIAGWACELGGALPIEQIRIASSYKGPDGNYPFVETVPNIAQSILGLTYTEAQILFTDSPEGHEYAGEMESGWPEPFREQWEDSRSRAERAQIAIAYLDHIIETGSVL